MYPLTLPPWPPYPLSPVGSGSTLGAEDLGVDLVHSGGNVEGLRAARRTVGAGDVCVHGIGEGPEEQFGARSVTGCQAGAAAEGAADATVAGPTVATLATTISNVVAIDPARRSLP